MFQKHKLLIPPIILLALSTWTFINSGENYNLTFQHYLGLISAIICAVSYFALKRFYKYILGTTLLFGLINLCNYTPTLTTTSLSFNSLSIGLQPYSLLLIILTVILAMPKKNEMTVVQSESVLKLREKQFNEDLEKFKIIFASKSYAELTAIIEDTKHTVAAKKAAQQILDTQSESKL